MMNGWHENVCDMTHDTQNGKMYVTCTFILTHKITKTPWHMKWQYIVCTMLMTWWNQWYEMFDTWQCEHMADILKMFHGSLLMFHVILIICIFKSVICIPILLFWKREVHASIFNFHLAWSASQNTNKLTNFYVSIALWFNNICCNV